MGISMRAGIRYNLFEACAPQIFLMAIMDDKQVDKLWIMDYPFLLKNHRVRSRSNTLSINP